MNADEEDDITEELLADAGKLTGLSLELLGLDPHPDDLTPEQRLQFEPEDLDEMAAVSPEDRKTAVSQTLLLAGLLWNSSGLLVDQLFRDLGTMTALDAVTSSDVAGSAVLSSLPPQFATSYDATFTRKFLVVASDVTASLVRGWTAPGCLAAELAVHCLLDQAEITEDIYELDLPKDWRAQVEEVLLEEAESPALYSDSPDIPEIDAGKQRIEGWFTPFTSGSTVPPYALA
ncbi:hypothetical protein [Pseudarthrobacter raffinosi]|uniref:hypothetical protein n=1 Tax=Pseudarthrobacter raffinosi TaxID=2953651 RepID=UPI00208E5CBF|nr:MULTISPECIES: hypothetical protein [unclassified Pseudarthrobacter]MCO4249752.1 hypothetical protein [Pseudarthrobacter sp. MDT3-9]MCO4262230.1 hypothetical protein [Pseudarthrobacter sp. MDT3-26]